LNTVAKAKKGLSFPMMKGRRKKPSPTAKFITTEENDAIAAYLANNEVTQVPPKSEEDEEE
jgi:hypothetical protein